MTTSATALTSSKALSGSFLSSHFHWPSNQVKGRSPRRILVVFCLISKSTSAMGFAFSGSASGAKILTFDEGHVHEIAYEETESYQITKLFLENREYFLERLLKEDQSQ